LRREQDEALALGQALETVEEALGGAARTVEQ
jgi:hypothetical protein